MPTDPQNEFDDPAIKQAVRRCWSGECATSALRAKVARLLEESSSPISLNAGSTARRINRVSWMIWPAALAAMLLMCVGLFNHFHPSPMTTASTLTPVLEKQLVDRHDSCCKMPTHQLLGDVKINDDTGIVRAMNQRLQQPVVMFHPADKQWEFKGAACCGVGNLKSGHLVFVDGGNAFSVFSLPLKTLDGIKDGDEFSDEFQNHSIIGFVKDGALFCLVSSGRAKPGIDDLKKMESQMQPRVAGVPGNSVMLAELLRPVR